MLVNSIFVFVFCVQLGLLVWWMKTEKTSTLRDVSSCRWVWEVIASVWVEPSLTPSQRAMHHEIRTRIRIHEDDVRKMAQSQRRLKRKINEGVKDMGEIERSIGASIENCLRSRVLQGKCGLVDSERQVVDPDELETLSSEGNIVAFETRSTAEG